MLLSILALTASTNGLAVDQEHQVMAQFIYNFARFIDWPDELGATQSPFVIGVYETDAYGRELSQTLLGKAVVGHRIIIQQVRSDDDIRGCRMLITGARDKGQIAKLARICENSKTVMIGEAPDFARDGGTIGFAVEGDRLRFDVNLNAARAARLTVSSKMLSLALHVYR